VRLSLSRRSRLLVLGAAVAVAVVVAVMLLMSPRHRAFDVRHVGPRVAMDAVKVVRAAAGRAEPDTAAIATRRQVLTADAEGLRIPMSDDPPPRLPAQGVPVGWELSEFAGRAEIELVRNDGRLAVRLRADRASFALYRDLVVGLDEFPALGWSWKIARLPAGGDVRQTGRDDQAAQVYVVFPRWPSPRTQSDIIGYVWDTTAPVGTTLKSPRAPNVRIVVVESGQSRAGAWRREWRNVAADYRTLFGRAAPRVGGIVVMTDSNDTGTAAEATFGDLIFARGMPKE
jgi:DUF3047 family protein